uniref:Ubiquitin-like protease family profile domain-containing protein n=1 Tax=Brassica campestris TaxID=3711 RepID=M4F8L1_BRACM
MANTETIELPPRFFPLGEEPVGLRVTPYHKPGGLRLILDTLDPEEVDVIKRSPFGKFLELADQTPYSGRLGRYMLSRQLKVRKKYEAWFLFAENPIRFSLREFATVTGLPCGKYPSPPSKATEKLISEQPYYNVLFGMLKEVTVSSVIRMLKRKTVTSQETRIKYALLALLASVILPTTHIAKISVEHAEKIKDLDEFFAYPWGRLSFEMLISSIKEKDELNLTQSTIALPGYVQSLQMVMTRAVPALTEIVTQDSASDVAGDADFSQTPPRNGIKPAHARTLDTAKNVSVTHIIPQDTDVEVDEAELCFSDEEDDTRVDSMVRLIKDGSRFSNQLFKGGATKADIELMREKADEAAGGRKKRKRKIPMQTPNNSDDVHAPPIDKGISKADIDRVEGKVDDLRESFNQFQEIIKKHISDNSAHLLVCQNNYQKILDSVGTFQSQSIRQTRVRTPTDNQTLDASKDRPTTTPIQTSREGIDTDIIRSVISNVQKTYGDKGPSLPASTPHTDDVSDSGDGGDPIPDENIDKENYTLPLQTINDQDPPDNSRVATSVKKTNVDRGPHMPDVGDLVNSYIIDKDIGNNQQTLSGNAHRDSNLQEDLSSEEVQLVEDQILEPTVREDTEVVGKPPSSPPDIQANAPAPTRKSNRLKTVSKLIVGVYECDKGTLSRFSEAYPGALNNNASIDYPTKFSKLSDILKTTKSITVGGISVSAKDLIEIEQRTKSLSPKMFDVLMHHIGIMMMPLSNSSQSYLFLDTKFVSILSKNYPRFKKSSQKEDFVFTPNLVEILDRHESQTGEVERIYFPFNLDQAHWIGLCFDRNTWKLLVLDCNTSYKSDSLTAKELAPTAQMLPYLLTQACRKLEPERLNPLTVERARQIPQNRKHADSGVTAALLMQAHAAGGIEACRHLSTDLVKQEAKRMAVMIFEENAGPI